MGFLRCSQPPRAMAEDMVQHLQAKGQTALSTAEVALLQKGIESTSAKVVDQFVSQEQTSDHRRGHVWHGVKQHPDHHRAHTGMSTHTFLTSDWKSAMPHSPTSWWLIWA